MVGLIVENFSIREKNDQFHKNLENQVDGIDWFIMENLSKIVAFIMDKFSKIDGSYSDNDMEKFSKIQKS